ncbi:MAG TPA: tRNA lysidine(34) synthetase TilS [Mycobacteriales bacterium]|jgi:tRNA(Ile)-lysidine synthase|nr:tRNA lysidine(34) synthetase TilS [Mycobacteriales bacterium]
MQPAVAAVRGAVRAAFTDLPRGGLVLAAVSGGADSMALAAGVAAEAPRLGLRAGAVTVDHRLQDGSAERATAVASACKALGLDPVEVETVTVDGRGGPEAAARNARYAALDRAAERLGAVAIAVGHTLDDQAETVLLRLARGSGARSLSGMPARRDRIVRPLLGLRRATTARACAELGIVVWDDPHNCDQSFARSRVRQVLMPALETALGPGVPEALARTADQLRADADALDGWAATVRDPTDVVALRELPTAVRTRVLRRAAIDSGVPAGALSAAHVADIDALVVDWRGQGPVSLPGGLVAHRACDRLWIR